VADSFHATIETILVLLLIVFAVALVARWARLPYTIALVVTGLLGFQPGFRDLELTPDLILIVFLPVLLFEGAYNVSARSLRRDLLPVTLLAVPGVLFSTLVTAALVHTLLGLGWAVALLFGALIASTDPIAVISLFRELGVPRRLALLVEGESLFNDGAAITLFSIVLAAITIGQFSIADGVLRFLVTVVGALAVGAIIGTLGSLLLRAVDNAQIQLTTMVIGAYGSYLLAEYFAFSGAIAVVLTGLLFGNYGSTGGLSLRSLHALNATWEFLGFVANSLIFLLIGIALDPRQLAAFWAPIAIAFLATLLGRAVAVYGLIPLLRGERAIPTKYRPVLIWGGLRGAVSLALVLSVPHTLPNGQPFPNRDLLQLMAFGVVGISLLLQGLSMPFLIRKLGLVSPNASTDELPIIRARLHAVEDALLALTYEHDQGNIGSLPFERLAQSYRREQGQLEQQLLDLEATTSTQLAANPDRGGTPPADQTAQESQ
jgi:CPA1 family monovalent cation:H+ antiporter